MSKNKSGGGAFSAIVILATAFFVVIGAANAQTPQPAQTQPPLLDAASLLGTGGPAPIIEAIQVRGNQRIEAQTVGSYLPLQAGMPADPELLDLTLKTLYNTGLFADVSIEMQPNGALLINLEENPLVNQVLLEGNKRIKDDAITEEIQLAPRAIYTRAKVQSDVQRLIELYRAKGRFAATVTPKVTPLPQNRIDVIYEVDEGPKTGIAKVNFVGNDIYTDNELRGVILTKESRWWNIFTSNDNYDPDRLEFERELLRQHYGRNGYADFQVVSSVAELTPDRKDFFVTFKVDEGIKYTVGDVRVKTTLAKLNNDILARFVPIKEGQVFNSEKIEDSVETITFATGSSGYAFVDVNPRLTRHEDTKTIDLTFEVNEGPRVYVERINIKGNVRTLDKIIRREVRLAEGDPFNRVLVDRSKSRVQSLGFFSAVEIEEKPGSAPDRTELDVSVEEQSTGSFSVGVGVSSTENFIVDLSVEERNLLGRGQLLRFRVQTSSRTRQVDIRFTQPYFLDRNLSAGGSLFNQRTNFIEAGFIRNRTGFGVNTGFQISEFGRAGLNYLFTFDDVFLEPTNPFNLTTLASGEGVGPLTQEEIDLLAIPGTEAVFSPFVNTLGQQTGTTTSVFRCNVLPTTVGSNGGAINPTCLDAGEFVTSLLGASVSFNKLNNPIRPSNGWQARLSLGVAGLGGNVNYYQGETSFAVFRPLPFGFVGALRGRAGYIQGFAGDNVRLSDRFFEGAATFRGFEVAGVGPRFIFSAPNQAVVGGAPQPTLDNDGQIFGQALGGRAYAIGTFEIQLPLPLPPEYGIRASLFTDFGSVGILDDSLTEFNNVPGALLDTDGDGIGDLAPIQDEFSLRVTAGISIGWNSPFGPIRFDIAEIIRQEIFDETEAFRFSAGTNF